MGGLIDILEIPVAKTKDVNDLVNWLEKEKIHQKENPSLVFNNDENRPAILILGFLMLLGLALLILEEKGKIKAKASSQKKSTDEFFSLMKSSRTEKSVERLIESRYNIDLVIKKSKPSLKLTTPKRYTIDDAFGLWKNKPISLQKVREEQWQRRK